MEKIILLIILLGIGLGLHLVIAWKWLFLVFLCGDLLVIFGFVYFHKALLKANIEIEGIESQFLNQNVDITKIKLKKHLMAGFTELLQKIFFMNLLTVGIGILMLVLDYFEYHDYPLNASVMASFVVLVIIFVGFLSYVFLQEAQVLAHEKKLEKLESGKV